MKGKMKKITAAAALAAAIILTGGGPLSGFMPDGASAAAVTFTDVTGNYWAYGDIDFAAQKGIVNGYDAAGGTHVFYPENQVSYEEAATMLYRALGAAGRLRTDSITGGSGSAASGGTANALTEEQQGELREEHAETLSAAN